jgi:carbon-monoxide dehydrogenase large subunit
MNSSGFGRPVRRVEDVRYLTGAGRYVDDHVPSGVLYGVVVRSPHAHARILGVDAGGARSSRGVVAVFTAADLDAAGIGQIPTRANLKNRDGSTQAKPLRPVLAADKVRFVGDPVAFVVAESPVLARDAAEAVVIEYDVLPSVTDAAKALEIDAPRVWDDIPGNLCVDVEAGDARGVEDAFARAAHVTRVDVDNQRVSVVPLEPRGAIGEYDKDGDAFTLTVTSQNVHASRNDIATSVLGIPPEKLRLVAPDVGGGFGTKNAVYPEYVLVLFAARALGRPVKWVGDRSESFLTDHDGRAQRSRVELALDEENNFLALRVISTADTGAYLAVNGPTVPTAGTIRTLGGLYRIPFRHFRGRVAFTHTVPVDPYRGAGRPEATYQIERIVDVAAAELGVDPIALRRRNVLAPSEIPYDNGLGHVFDSGDFPTVLDRALTISDWPGFASRAEESRRSGKRRGIGICFWLACTGGPPREYSALRFTPEGRVTVQVGTQSTGMGHETTVPQLVSTFLGMPFDSIDYLQGDTGRIAAGGGHSGSRSLGMAGSALRIVSDRVLEKARRLAAHLLEVASSDLEFSEGAFRVAGTDRTMTMVDVIRASFEPSRRPPDMDGALDDQETYERPALSYPNGCHVAEVEIDPDTGAVVVVDYSAIEDAGPLLNPMTTEGQVMGGVAQGVGQAVLESVAYDATGQRLTGSLMDYCLPRADDLPSMRVGFFEDAPSTNNLLGIKGVGEAGCVGAPPAVVNAVVNALSDLGVRHVDMPLTSESIWRVLQAATNEKQERAGG